jgi:subtilase family serine protease
MSTSIQIRASQLIALISLAAIPLVAFPALQDRITAPIEASRLIPLKGNIPYQIRVVADQGALDPSTKILGMRLMLKQTAAQNADLVQLLQQQMDQKSPSYHKWLTPEEFGDRFGVSAGDLAKLTKWLASQGFAVQQIARARNWITFDGTAAAVESAFQTSLHRYGLQPDEIGSKTHFANASEPSIPGALENIVESVRGLDDFHPRPQHKSRLAPKYNWSNGSHALAPDDMAAIYDIAKLYAAGIDGTGQKLAIVGQTDVDLSLIAAFRNNFGLSVNPPQLVLTGPDPGYSPEDAGESYLDLEWSGAVARNATILFVYSTDVFNSALYTVDQALAPVMSMSYGYCEPWSGTSVQTWAQQANAEGITWMSSSGDSGAASCDSDGSTVATQGLAILTPANVPEITAVGGSEFNEGSTGWNSQNGSTQASVTGYLPEMVWNDSSLGYGLDSGGGGVSVRFTKPWWQAGPGVPNDGGRDVPDVSLTASADHDGYLVWVGGLEQWGGTSASSPTFAGIVTLINQYLVNQGIQATPGLGNINPILYNLAQNSSGVFHDITVGSNSVPCTIGTTNCTTGSMGYSAGPGYDLASGLGSVDAYNLVMNWSSVTPLVATTTAVTAAVATISQGASVQLTATVTPVSGTTTPSGTFTFTLAGNSIASAAVSPSTGNNATATVTIPGSSLSVGSNTITAGFVSNGGFSTSVASVAVTTTCVTTTTTLTTNNPSISSTGMSLVSLSVTAATGTPASAALVIMINGNTIGAISLQPPGSSANAFDLSPPQLATGANSITMRYVGAPGYLASTSAPLIITVAAPPVATSAVMTATPASISSAATTVLTATVTPASGTAAPTGTVTFKLGNTTLGSTAVVASGAKSAGSFTVNGSSLAVGSNSISASFTATGSFTNSTAAATVIVTPAGVSTTTAIAASVAGIPADGVSQLTATVTPASGTAVPTGTLAFKLGSTTLGSATLTPNGSKAVASFTLSGGSLAAGANSVTASYSGTGNFLSSNSAATTITVTAALPATTTSATAAPSSIAASASTVLTATVKPTSGSVAPAGSVTFIAGSTALGTAALKGSGTTATATLTVPGSSLVAGTNSITVTYLGSTTFAASTSAVTVTLPSAPVATTTTLTATPSTLAVTGTTQLVANIAAATGTAAPTGTVNFSLGAASLGSATIVTTGSASTATLTVTGAALAVGSNSVTATYAGSTQFLTSAGSAGVTVSTPVKVSTTLAFTLNPSTIASTGTAQLIAVVTPASGTAPPTGTVTYSTVGGFFTVGTATLVASGSTATATLTVNAANATNLGLGIGGGNNITASYAGTPSFGSSSALEVLTINPPPAIATSLVATASPATIASSGTTQISVTVTPASGAHAPTGSVSLAMGPTTLGTAPLVASGANATATFTVNGSSLGSGLNSIAVSYAGTSFYSNTYPGYYLGSSSGSATVTVKTNNQVATSITATASPSTVVSNATTQVAVTLTPASGTTAPGGSISFALGQVSLGTATLAASGANATASLTVNGSSLSLGANSITATYSGTSAFSGSTGSVTVTATPPAQLQTSLVATASPASIPSDYTTQVSVTLTPASGVTPPTGSIAFTLGQKPLGTATLSASGSTAKAVITISASSLNSGANTITATYAGNTAFAGSSGSTTVTTTASVAIPTTLTATMAAASIAPTTTTQILVTVTPAAGNSAPTGTVSYSLGQTSLGAASQLTSSGSNGTSSLTINGSILAPGVNTITATYQPTSPFTGSTGSATVTLIVPAKVATTLTSSASPAGILSSATTQLSVTVTPASGAAPPTGTVSFALGQTSLGAATLTSSGLTATAVLTVNGGSLVLGANTITATYEGTTAFGGSIGSAAVTVTAPVKVATTLIATAGAASIGASGSTQLTATVTPASGSAAPTGSVTFTLGKASLGSATLTTSGLKATAVLNVNGSALAAGANSITATYAGTTAFASSTGSATITVPTASKVGLALAKASSNQPGFPLLITLTETAGVATTVTGWTIAGTSFTSAIGAALGSTALPARGNLSDIMIIGWSPMPNPLVVVFTGADADGAAWSVTSSIATK